MLLPNRALHLRIHHTRPNTNRRHIRLLNRQREREMIQNRFAGPVGAPALVCAGRCAAGRDYDSAARLAQKGQRGLYHAHRAEDVDVVCGAPFFGRAVGDFLDRVEGAVVED